MFSYTGDWAADCPNGKGTATYYSRPTSSTQLRSVKTSNASRASAPSSALAPLPPLPTPQQLPSPQASSGPSRAGSASSGAGATGAVGAVGTVTSASAVLVGDKAKDASRATLSASGAPSGDTNTNQALPVEQKPNPAESLLMEYDVKASFEGFWKEGKYHGQGRYAWADGTWYLGEWVDGR
ncbi:hypothetical protein HDU93_005775 [Gonapodya sp. JEL0774]|nr:hypothetical protein HDU93_005775 [Gonapodya sp. JEL0774]